ncbi:hypothetical protein EMCRGX_G019170 [Ephydatia muelleri]
MKSIKQSQKRNGLLKGNSIGRVLNLVAWRLECDTGRLNIHWNAIERVLPIKSPKISNHSLLLVGRSSYEEIANLSEDEDGKEDVAKATEDGTRCLYYTETVNSNACGICLCKVWEQDFCMVLYVLCVTIV